MPKRSITLALGAAFVIIFAIATLTLNPVNAAGKSAVAGQKVYAANCSSCHQATGKGQSGVFPPLAGNAAVTGDASKLITIVKTGLSGKLVVDGTTYDGQMPAFKDKLSNAQIAAVITYIRSSWGNQAGAVTEAQVAAAK